MQSNGIVSREEWLVARKAQLKHEKALTRMRDMVVVYNFLDMMPKGRDEKEIVDRAKQRAP